MLSIYMAPKAKATGVSAHDHIQNTEGRACTYIREAGTEDAQRSWCQEDMAINTCKHLHPYK